MERKEFLSLLGISAAAVILDNSIISCSPSIDNKPLMPSSMSANLTAPSDLLQNVLKQLQTSDKNKENITYALSTNNSLIDTWLIQSKPNDTTCALLDGIKQKLNTLVLNKPSSPHYIDILHLANDKSDDAFQSQLTDVIIKIAGVATNKVIIRYLEGNVGGTPPEKSFTFIDGLKAKYQGKSLTNVTVYAATFNYPWTNNNNYQYTLPGSWNHAKIFAIDGITCFTGGQNYWDDYLPPSNPPYDISMRVNGDAVKLGHLYANFLWDYVAHPTTASTSHKALTLGAKDYDTSLPVPFSSQSFPTPTQPEQVPILAVGNLGIWGEEGRFIAEELAYSLATEQLSPKNTYPELMNAKNPPLWYPFSKFDSAQSKAMQASTTARHLLLQQVQQNGHLRISQQKIADTDLVTTTNIVLWPGEFLEAIVAAMADKKAKVDILLSHHMDSYSDGYSDDMGGQALGGVFVDMVAKKMGTSVKEAVLYVRNYLSIKQIPVGSYNHAKVWIVDDSVFCVGSDNIYPAYLQEFSYIVGSTEKTQAFIQNYWNYIWSIGENVPINKTPGSGNDL